MTFRDARTSLEYVRSCADIRRHGLTFHLQAYQGHVFWEFQEVHDGSAGQWRRLAERLAGAGVPSLEDAMRELQLEPVHAPLRAVFDGPAVAAVLDGVAREADLAVLETRFAAFLAGVAEATRVTGDPAVVAVEVRERTARGFAAVAGELARVDRAALLGWLALSRMGALAPDADVAATSAAWFDELRLATVLAGGFRRAGLDEAEAWAAADLVRVLLVLPLRSSIRAAGVAGDRRLVARWNGIDRIRAAMGVNTWEGVTWLDGDRFRDLVRWAATLDAVESGAAPDATFVRRLTAAAEAAGYRLDRLVGAARATSPHAGAQAQAQVRPLGAGQSNTIRRRSAVDGAPCASTASRWSRYRNPGVSPKPPGSSRGTIASGSAPTAAAARRRASSSIAHISIEPV